MFHVMMNDTATNGQTWNTHTKANGTLAVLNLFTKNIYRSLGNTFVILEQLSKITRPNGNMLPPNGPNIVRFWWCE